MTEAALVLGEALVDVVNGPDGSTGYPGGSAANVAVALARLGRPTWFGTSWGDDADGRLLATHLDAAGVSLAGDPHVVARTSTAVATIGATGAATYDFDLDWRLGEVLLPAGVRPVVLHVGSIGALLEPGASAVLAEVRRHSGRITVSYDVNVRPGITGTGAEVVERVRELVALADVVKASDEDLAALWPDLPPDRAARELLELGPSLVAMTAGPEGARWWTRAAQGAVAPLPVAVADTIGAGDTFSAGLIDALWERRLLGGAPGERLAEVSAEAWEQVVDWAARAAAVTVSRPGADPPHRHEVPER